ncbi:MAG: alpha-glucan family phosphorylase, partial [Deltaproteobacteria bacterium]
MDMKKPFTPPYEISDAFRKKVAYFCMEFGIDHPLRIYSGGLGYLAGSHMRSAYTLGQNLVGIGILWKFGYYEQQWNDQNELQAVFRERFYNFLEDTGIRFRIEVNNHPVWVKAWYLPPHVFGTAPVFLLSTDLPENDYLARTICHRLYDDNVETK